MDKKEYSELTLLKKGSSVRLSGSELTVLRGTASILLDKQLLHMEKGKSLELSENIKQNLILRARYHADTLDLASLAGDIKSFLKL